MAKTVPAMGASTEGSEIVPYQAVNDAKLDRDPESDTEAESQGPDQEWVFWKRQISAAMVHERRWRAEALECETLYFGEDHDPGVETTDDSPTSARINDRTAMIHANIDTLKPLIYSETPTPVVRRRFRGDGKIDETDLMAAEAVQRLAAYILDTEDFDTAMMAVRDDWLIAGRGAARVLYKADFEKVEVIDPMTQTMAEVEIKASERVCCQYVEWRRLLLAPSHSWTQLPWLAFEVPMTRSKIEARFGKDVADGMSFTEPGLTGRERGISDEDREQHGLSGDMESSGEPMVSPFDTAVVWEIWSRETKEVIWFSPDYKGGLLDRVEDPLFLEKFYPMPKPLLASTRGEKMTPRPDIKYYERRAREMDIAAVKMREILDAMSVSGLFPGEMKDEVSKLLSGESQMIPVSSWIRLMEKGGTTGIIQWLPLQAMIQAIQALVTLREQSKQAMFEASGVSDIMRAQGDPNETATAQQIKGKYAGLRLSERQRRKAEYARDTLRLMIEIAVEMFDTEYLADITGLKLPMTEREREILIQTKQQAEQQHAELVQLHQAATQMLGVPLPELPEPPKHERIPDTSWEAVHAKLRTDLGRKITISIETESTILTDELQDKELRIEFITSFSMLMERLAPMLGSGMFDMKVVKEMMLFGIRGFPKARTIEQLIMQLPDDQEQPEQGPPVQVQVAQIRAEVDKMLAELESSDKEKDRQHDMRMKGVEMIEDAAKMTAEAATPPQAPQMQEMTR